jgi:uncharacterized protein (DUF2225 family)
MMCFAKPVVTVDLYLMQKEEFLITCYMCNMIFIRENLTFSSERMLHKDYGRKGSVEKKKSVVVSFKGLGAKKN